VGGKNKIAIARLIKQVKNPWGC